MAFLAVVLGTLFVASALTGRAGVFSSAEKRLDRQLADPATRLAATIRLADQFAGELAPEHPMIPGAQGEQDCPAAWTASATSLVGALTPAEATKAFAAARSRFGNAGWRVRAVTASSLTATQRRGLQVDVSEQPGGVSSTLTVTVTVPCRPTRPSATQRPPPNSTRLTTTSSGG